MINWRPNKYDLGLKSITNTFQNYSNKQFLSLKQTNNL